MQTKLRKRVQLVTRPETGKTKSEFKEQCSIQTILNKYTKTGLISHLNRHNAQYGDFTKVTDFQSAAIQLNSALNTFMELPAQIRAKFDNDVSKLLTFIENPKNSEEAINLGLLPKGKAQVPPKAEIPKTEKVEEKTETK